MLSLVVARDRNGAIGRDGAIPWHLPEDLGFFQRETTGAPIIMGRRTWESLPYRPLKNRMNIVVSSGAPDAADHVAPSVNAALAAAHAKGHARLYGIGGAGIYAEMLPMADRLLVTEVDLEVSDADTWFPAIEPAHWSAGLHLTLRDAAPRCVLVEYLRVRSP
ncbi:MAG: dihydrofolate reductase [Pseudomonadota bacterium]